MTVVPRHLPVPALIVAVVALALAGCAAGDAGGPGWAGTRDTVAGVEVVRNPAAPLLDDGAVVASVAWTAAGGESADDDAPVWERPGAVRVADGVVYVLDALAARVYAHRASDGEYTVTIGRKGPGPGEVEQPMGFALPPGELVLPDGSAELEVFDRSGTHLRSIRPEGIVFGLDALGADRLLLRRFQTGDSPRWAVLGPSGEPAPLEPPAWRVEAPVDFGGGPATLHLFDEDGVYLARLTFDRAWTDFDAAGGRVYALEKDPETDLASLVAYRIEVPAVDVADHR